jgi:hypothetical protein
MATVAAAGIHGELFGVLVFTAASAAGMVACLAGSQKNLGS